MFESNFVDFTDFYQLFSTDALEILKVSSKITFKSIACLSLLLPSARKKYFRQF